MNRILIVCLSFVSIVIYAENNFDASFERIAKIQEEMKYWQNQLISLEKQKQKGNVSRAYIMMLNAISTEMQMLRKEAIILLEEINKEEERIKTKKERAEKDVN